MTRKAKRKNRGGGNAGLGEEKGGHAKWECPHCKITAPDVKSMRIHHDAKHPEIPFEEDKIVRHAESSTVLAPVAESSTVLAPVAESSKPRPGVLGSPKKISLLMSADLASGNSIVEGVYTTKRRNRDVAIKIITNKKKAETEIEAYENHDNGRNIVCLYDSWTERDYGVLVLELAKCNLRELVNCGLWKQELKDTTSQKAEFIKGVVLWKHELKDTTSQKTEFMKGFEGDKLLWKNSVTGADDGQLWQNMKPTPLALDLIRDIVYGLEDLHTKKFVHGCLEPSNILIFEHLGRLSAKISMNRDNCKKYWSLSDFINVGQLNTLEDLDMFGLGLIIYFLVKGDHAFGDEGHCQKNYKNKKEKLFKVSKELGDLVLFLTYPVVDTIRRDIFTTLSHPVFWSPTRRLLFYCEVSEKLSRVYNWKINKNLSPESKKIIFLVKGEMNTVNENKEKNWKSQIDAELWNHLVERVNKEAANEEDEMFKKGDYVVDSAKDLIRFIRNVYQHRNSVEIEAIVGKTHTSIDEYFGKKFPSLLIKLYCIARKYWWNDENFSSFIESGL